MSKMVMALFPVVMALFVFSAKAEIITVEAGSDLQTSIDRARNGDTLFLAGATFSANPTHFVDSLCGNCLDQKTLVQASYGFIIKDKALTLVGALNNKTQLVTKAGYGLYFKNSAGSLLRNLTITGGRRDADGNATDAAIVVRRSSIRIEEIDILNNDHRDSTVVVGIGGVFGREGAEIFIERSRIINGGWDGVALYRGASAVITDCLIKDGRGAGIGVTWDATCVAYRNEVTGFWKGIGSFGTATLIARNNLVHENLGWGMVATGESLLEAINNVIYHNGNCGIAPWSTEARGRIINNIIAENGWRKEWVCPCVGVLNYGDWAKWKFRNNIVWNNKEGEYDGIWDQTDINGNLKVDPKLNPEDLLLLTEDSPALHAGDSLIFNVDGTRSHIGLKGGPQGIR